MHQTHMLAYPNISNWFQAQTILRLKARNGYEDMLKTNKVQDCSSITQIWISNKQSYPTHGHRPIVYTSSPSQFLHFLLLGLPCNCCTRGSHVSDISKAVFRISRAATIPIATFLSKIVVCFSLLASRDRCLCQLRNIIWASIAAGWRAALTETSLGSLVAAWKSATAERTFPTSRPLMEPRVQTVVVVSISFA